MTESPKTRSERQAQTRDQLIWAAMEVFTAKGFHGASLDEIARHAGFTKGAVYANFAGKDDLFLAVVDRRIEVAFGETEESDIEIGAGELFETTWATLSLEVILYALRTSPELHRELARRYEQIDQMVSAGLQQTRGLSAEEAPTAALVRSALHEGLMLRRLADPDQITAEYAEKVHQEFFDAALAGRAQQTER